MSREYDLYLEQHKGNVAKGFHWIRENLPELVDLYYGGHEDLEHQICFAHDASKTDSEEYDAYDRYFYGGGLTLLVDSEGKPILYEGEIPYYGSEVGK